MMNERAEKIIAAISPTMGLRASHIAKTTGMTVMATLGILGNLRRFGYVCKIETGEWRLTKKGREAESKEPQETQP